VEVIAAVLFEPVGCLAEFRADEFDHSVRALFDATAEATSNGSQAYWRLLGLLNEANPDMIAHVRTQLEEFELAAVEHADGYEDVVPALEKLRSAGVGAYLATSLSRRAVTRFTERFALSHLLAGSISRDEAHGVMAQPLRKTIEQASIEPRQAIYLVDTDKALDMAKGLGVTTLLMINDYDEGRALAERSPAGGVVSLAELTDALLLIEQRAGLRSTARMPYKPFELFDPG
jgi:phosphoglycolate phosphatase-like HAD superfamily hydrolase